MCLFLKPSLFVKMDNENYSFLQNHVSSLIRSLRSTEQTVLCDISNKKVPKNNDLFIDIKRLHVDGRTTCMIRNIPNKYTQKMFIDTINKTHFGTFDFLYLVFDFQNECNIGYSFINFTSTEHIETFIQQYEGKKWPLFNSDKKCSVCYAKIQGIKILLDRFPQLKNNA